jgi:hypothetical protein
VWTTVSSRSRPPCWLSLVFLFSFASFRSLVIARSLSLSLLRSFSPEGVKRGAMRQALGTTTGIASFMNDGFVAPGAPSMWHSLAIELKHAGKTIFHKVMHENA